VHDTLIQKLLCFGMSNAIDSVIAIGGTAPYSFSLNGAPAVASGYFDNLAVGVYTVNVTDATNAASVTTFTITQPTNLFINNITEAATACDEEDVAITVFGGIGAYYYSTSAGGTWLSNNVVHIGPYASPTTYYITVADANNCTVTTVINAIPFCNPIIGSTQIVLNVSNNGGTNGAITNLPNNVTNTITSTYTAYELATPNTIINATLNNSNNTFEFLNLSAGTYHVMRSVTNWPNATSFLNIVVTQPAPSSITATANIVHNICYGNTTGSVSISPSGGATPYTYSLNGAASQSSNIFSNLASGTYTIIVTDNVNATVQQLITITQPAALSVISNGVAADCECIRIFPLGSGGTLPYLFDVNNVGFTNINTGGFLPICCPGFSPCNFILSVKDANGCVASVAGSGIPVPKIVSSFNATVSNVTTYGGNDGSIKNVNKSVFGLLTINTYLYNVMSPGTIFVPTSGTQGFDFLNLVAGTYILHQKYDDITFGMCGGIDDTFKIIQPFSTNLKAQSVIESIAITPNPTTNFVEINVGANNKSPIQIMDCTGKLVSIIQTELNKNNYNFSFKNLPKGLYIIKCGGMVAKAIYE
jgi:large repetitive protein